jgi:hypothetical protein
MSNRITNVSAVLSTTDLTFSSGLRRAREDLARTASAAEQIQAQTSRLDMWGGLLPTFDVGNLLSQAMGNVGRIFDEIENGLKRIEQRSDAGEVLGFTYQQMQALEVAATVADMPVDRLSQTFGRLLKSVAMAGQGSKEARKDLERLGLTVKDLEGMTAWQVIGLVADRLSEINSPADRAAAAIGLFGREAGLKMTQVLGGGADAMERYINKARELGLVLEQDLVDKAKLAADQMDFRRLGLEAARDRESARLADSGVGQSMEALRRAPETLTVLGMRIVNWIDEAGVRAAALLDAGTDGMVAVQQAQQRGFPSDWSTSPRSGTGTGPTPLVAARNETLSRYERDAKEVDERIETSRRIRLEETSKQVGELEAKYHQEMMQDEMEMQKLLMREYERDGQRILDGELAGIRQRFEAEEDFRKLQEATPARADLLLKGSAKAQQAIYEAQRGGGQTSGDQDRERLVDSMRRMLEGVTVKVQGGGTTLSVVPL